MRKQIPFIIALAGLIFSSIPSVFAQDASVSTSTAPVELAVDRDKLGPSPSAAYRHQTPQQLEKQIEVSGELSRSDNNAWDIKTNDETYRIQNPESWFDEDWFKDGATVQLFGNLRPDIQRKKDTPVIMASHIFHVKVSAVQTTRDRIEEEIKDQMTTENAKKYAKQVPFLKRMLDRIGW